MKQLSLQTSPTTAKNRTSEFRALFSSRGLRITKNRLTMNNTGTKFGRIWKEIWRIKEKNGNYTVKWRILRQYPTYNPASKRCMLCANEKAAILYYGGTNLLNKRTEIISTCRHRKKYELGELDVNYSDVK